MSDFKIRSGEVQKFWRDLEYLWVYLAVSWEIKGGFHTLTDIRLTLLTQIVIFWEKSKSVRLSNFAGSTAETAHFDGRRHASWSSGAQFGFRVRVRFRVKYGVRRGVDRRHRCQGRPPSVARPERAVFSRRTQRFSRIFFAYAIGRSASCGRTNAG